MKRTIKIAVLLVLVAIVGALMLTSCECKHEAQEWKITDQPTCKKVGTKSLCCTGCGEVFETVELPKTAHKQVVIEGIDPTCKTEGLTDGVKCSVCNETLVKQETLELVDHKYTNDSDRICDTCGGERYCTHANITFIQNTPEADGEPATGIYAVCDDCGKEFTLD